jgi:Flp pilus assembly protein TadD/mono/diheme cytochrome c family protein
MGPNGAAVLLAVGVLCGCRPGAPSGEHATATGPAPTYSKDVAPILAANCAGCHQPGQGAPFNLLTFDDARVRAADIATATSARIMPPWLPEPIVPAFVGERRLTPEQIATLRRWAETGAARGEPMSPPAAARASGDWSSGPPDLILRPARAYVLSPGNGDVFRNLVIRTSLPADRFVRAVEFRPGDAPVHHAVLHLDPTPSARARDGGDGQPGFDGMGASGTRDPDGHFVGWAPGRGPIVSAEGRPWRLARGTDLVVELHLIPQPKPVAVQPTVGLFFAERTTNPPPLMLKMGSNAIDIPAGATDYAITDKYTLPADASILSLYPHAHFLGKEMQVHALLPDGTTRTLLFIRRWSFHWQQDYRFSTPVALPRGTTIAMRFTYDNSEANKDNPHRPPVRVTVGQRSTDEMGNLLLQVLPVSAPDRATFEAEAAAREATANVVLAEQLVRANPRSAEQLTFLGASYTDAGRFAEGIAALNAALRLDPTSWQAHHELGGALFKSGKIVESVREFQEAARIRPAEASVQFNLGQALVAAGSATAGRTALTRALALSPDFAEAHHELGALLFAGGQVNEAIRHLRRAAALSPDSSNVHGDLGGALAQAGLVAEALTHLRLALGLDPGNAAARENLARLQRGR